MLNNTYGNFAQAREGMKSAMYGAISFLTYFVLNNANAADADKEDYLYIFSPNDVVLIPIYNGIIGEIENLRIIGLMVDDNHDLYVKTDEETYSLTDYNTDIIVVGAVWNILEHLYQYFDLFGIELVVYYSEEIIKKSLKIIAEKFGNLENLAYLCIRIKELSLTNNRELIMKEVCVEKRIEEVAKSKIGGKYNLVQFKEEKKRLMIHKSVCQAVLAFRDENVHMPMYAILSCGISAGAFKNEEFEKGYTHFDAEKAKTIFEMAKAYNAAMGGKGMPADVLYRVAARYYKKVSHNLADMEKKLSTAKKMVVDRKNFEELCMNVGA